MKMGGQFLNDIKYIIYSSVYYTYRILIQPGYKLIYRPAIPYRLPARRISRSQNVNNNA